MKIIRFTILCGLLALTPTWAWANCNQVNWAIFNGSHAKWTLSSHTCTNGYHLTSVSHFIYPHSGIAGVITGGNATEGVTCELNFYKANDRAINFTIAITQQPCTTSSGSNHSEVREANGVNVGVSGASAATYEGDVAGSVIFTILP